MLLEVPDLAALLAGSPACRGRPSARCVALEVRSEIAAGENYGSTFLKALVHFRDDGGGGTEGGGVDFSKAVVCKRLPPTEHLRDVFNVNVSFPKEVNFYLSVVPALESLQTELRIPEAERLRCFPAFYGARLGVGKDPSVVDDEAILVLEDLSTDSYYTGDRREGLDMEHCKLAVRELARFHAASIALRRLRSSVFESPPIRDALAYFMHDRSEDDDAIYAEFVENAYSLVLDRVPEVLDIVDAERFRRATLTYREPEADTASNPFLTISHEDFWVNNMLFHRDPSGRPDRLKMVDFQLTQVGPAARDLLFFVYSSADSAALTRADELLRDYHDELVRYARLHGLDASDLGWDAFERELALTARYQFSHLLAMIVIIRAKNVVEKSDTNSIGAFSESLGIGEHAKTRYLEFVADWAKRGWI